MSDLSMKTHIRLVDQQLVTTVLEITCPFCKKISELRVSTIGLTQWEGGAYVQNCMSELTDDQREAFITGVCPPCFEELIG